MLGDGQVDVGGPYLQKAFGRWCPASDALGEVRADSVAPHHPALFLAEGHKHGESQAFDDALLPALEEREPVEAGAWRRLDLVTCQRVRRGGKGRVADSLPRVVQRRRIAMDVERIRDLLRRQRESELDLTTRSVGADRRLGEGNDRASEEGADRLVGGVVSGLQELKRPDECDSTGSSPHDSRRAPPSYREIIGELELFAGRMIPSLAYYCGLQATFLIDVNRSPNRDHRIEFLDVFVAHADAAVADRLPDGFGVIGAMDTVTVAELEPAGSQHAHVPARGSAVGRNDDVAIRDNLLAFDPSP